MKRLILALAPNLALALLPSASPALAQPTESIRCPGETTVEMRHCAGLSWNESSGSLQRKLPPSLYRRWQEATRAVCAHAYAPFQAGTIYPQLVVGCDDQLNRALLKQFEPINNQGDAERAP